MKTAILTQMLNRYISAVLIVLLSGCGASPSLLIPENDDTDRNNGMTNHTTVDILEDTAPATDLITFHSDPSLSQIPITVHTEAFNTKGIIYNDICTVARKCRIKVRQSSDRGNRYLTFVVIRSTSHNVQSEYAAWYGHGSYDILWDGTDSDGAILPAGSYEIALKKPSNGYRTQSLSIKIDAGICIKNGLFFAACVLYGTAELLHGVELGKKLDKVYQSLQGYLVDLGIFPLEKPDPESIPFIHMIVKHCGRNVKNHPGKNEIVDINLSDLDMSGDQVKYRYGINFIVTPQELTKLDVLGTTRHRNILNNTTRRPVDTNVRYRVEITDRDNKGIGFPTPVENYVDIVIPPLRKKQNFYQVTAFTYRDAIFETGQYGEIRVIDYKPEVLYGKLYAAHLGLPPAGHCDAH